MTTINQIENKNEINEKEFSHMANFLFSSFLVTDQIKDKTLLEKKGKLIGIFANFLNKYLEMEFVNNRNERLEMINFIDKINLQKELIELQNGVTNIKDIQVAASRLGRKSQSAFKTK